MKFLWDILAAGASRATILVYVIGLIAALVLLLARPWFGLALGIVIAATWIGSKHVQRRDDR